MAATLSLDMDYTDKVQTLYQDSVEQNGLTILPPDINSSTTFSNRFYAKAKTTPKPSALRSGRGQGTGQSAVEAITNERAANGAFASSSTSVCVWTKPTSTAEPSNL